jgi:hypothetical protein
MRDTLVFQYCLFLARMMVTENLQKGAALGGTTRINNHHPKVGIVFPAGSRKSYL